MNYDQRRERGKTICASLVEDVGKVATPGLGAWPEAWVIVGPDSATFMELLIRWEQTGEPHLIDRVAQAYDKVVSAWRDAARSYELGQQNLA